MARKSRKKAVNKMVKTKATLHDLRRCEKCKTMVENGATLGDIMHEFHIPTITAAKKFIERSLELGGQIGTAAGADLQRKAAQALDEAVKNPERTIGRIAPLIPLSKEEIPVKAIEVGAILAKEIIDSITKGTVTVLAKRK